MIYVFDLDGNLSSFLSQEPSDLCPYWGEKISEKLNGELSFEFQMPTTHSTSHLVDVGCAIVFQDTDGSYRYTKVVEIEDNYETTSSSKTVTCQGGHYDLVNRIVHKVGVIDGNAKTALAQVLKFTDWEVGTVDEKLSKELHSISFTFQNALRCIQDILDKWKCEATYRVVLREGKIEHKYIDITKQRGEYRGVQFTFDRNLTSVTRKVDFSNVCTRMYGKGKTLFTNKDGTYEFADFQDMVWTTPNDPVNKPKGQIYVDNPPAIKKWGIRTGVHTEDTDDIKVLLENTWKDLQSVSEPKINYEINCVDLSVAQGYEFLQVHLGDIIEVKDLDMGFDFSARVLQVNRSLTTNELTITIGNTLELCSKGFLTVHEKIEELVETVPTHKEITDIVKHNTELITGNKGGYVQLVLNDEEEPCELIVTDNKEKMKARNVWRFNKSGLGFSNTGYNGSYGTAITMDGHISADYIHTGVLRSKDGTCSLDLNRGAFTVKGDTALPTMDFDKLGITFYDWDGKTTCGKLYPTRRVDQGRKGVALYACHSSYLSLGVEDDGARCTPVFTIQNDANKSDVPYYGTFNESIDFGSNTMYWWDTSAKDLRGALFASAQGNLCIGANTHTTAQLGTYWVKDKIFTPRLVVSNPNEKKAEGYSVYAYGRSGVTGDFNVYGSLYVSKDKHCVQSTEHYGDLLYSAYETPVPQLGFNGEGKITDNACYIYIDPQFLESVDTTTLYQVKTWIYEGSITKVERHADHFIVYGEEGTQFGFEVFQTRKGFTNTPYRTLNEDMLSMPPDEEMGIPQDTSEVELQLNNEEDLLDG